MVGTVGGIALGASRSGDKVLGVKLPKPKRVKLRSKDLSKVAKEVGRFGENVGELTTELKRAREGLANGEGKQQLADRGSAQRLDLAALRPQREDSND